MNPENTDIIRRNPGKAYGLAIVLLAVGLVTLTTQFWADAYSRVSARWIVSLTGGIITYGALAMIANFRFPVAVLEAEGIRYFPI